MTQLPTLSFKVSGAKKTGGAADTDVVAVYQDAAKKAVSPKGAYGSVIDRLKKSAAFAGKANSVQFVRFGGRGGSESLLTVGLGAPGRLTYEKLRAAAGHAYGRLKAERARNVAIHLDTLLPGKGLKPELSFVQMAGRFAEGLILSAYQWDKYKTKKDTADAYAGPARIVFVSSIAKDKASQKELAREIARVQAIGDCVTVTRDWSNEPSNLGTPEFYAGEAKRLAHEHGLKVRVLTEKDAEKEKMGLFLGVGQGAEREGRIVVLEYVPAAGKDAKTLALVGKGITFDSGGVSIKPSLRMEEMKHDMTGAATVMGAVMLAARWQVPNRVVGIMAFTENMPDGNAIQPGNVLTSRSGKTVEIFNTDAEGRLILADALDFAQDFKPDAVIDIATLTGAVSIALGKHCGAVLGNDPALVDQVRNAGDQVGERIWELPLFDDYFDDMRSDTADMKNSVNDGNGGTIRGAIFLKQFIRPGTRWAHLDIAATAWGVTHLSYLPKKGASGLYVRTLARLAQAF